MHSMNHVFLMGNLTRDPEVRTLPSGVAVTDLGLAVNEHYKDKEGNTVQRVAYIDIVVWGKRAEACSKYLKKGAPIMVEGKLQLDQWETDNGDKRSKLRVRAWRVQFLGERRTTGEPAKEKATAAVADDEVPFEAEDMPF